MAIANEKHTAKTTCYSEYWYFCWVLLLFKVQWLWDPWKFLIVYDFVSGANIGCVSLLKSKFLIIFRKRMFFFFAKIQKRVIDANDPQRRWILCPGVGGGGGVWGRCSTNVYTGRSKPPRGRTRYPFIWHFLRIRYPFRRPSINKWHTPFSYLV